MKNYKSGIILFAVCVSVTENESKGGDAMLGKHMREQEEPNINPDTSGGDFLLEFQDTQFRGRLYISTVVIRINTAATLW